MAPNETFLQKADQSVADFTAGGKVPDEKLQRFILTAIKESDTLKLFRHQTFRGTEFELPRLGMDGRVLRPAGERVILPENERVTPSIAKVTLIPVQFRALYKVSYDVLEDQIEQGTFLPTMEQAIPKAITRDLTEVVLMGDTAGSGDSTLKAMNGLFKQITSNTVDFDGARFGKTAAEAMYRKMPAQFRDKSKLIFLVSSNSELDYMFSVANRQTAEGDRMMVSGQESPRWNGIRIIQDPNIHENLEGTTDRTVAGLLNPQKVVIGWKREMTLDTVQDKVAGEYTIVARMRVDVKLENQDECVKGTDILAA